MDTRRIKRHGCVLALGILALLIAACSGEEATEPTATPAEATALPRVDEIEGRAPTLEELANIEYSNEFTQSGTAKLENGEYSEEAAPGSATKTTVTLTDYVAFGELNGQPAAAVVTVTDPGGSGTFYTLHVVQVVDGQPVEVAYTSLGDRTQINSVSIEGNQIVVDMVTHDPDDSMCCPTQQVVNTYELQEDQLVETSSEVVGSAEPSGGVELTGPIWNLTQLNGEDLLPATSITAEFGKDGQVGGSSGCNSYGGPYTVDGQNISMGPLMSTMMACLPPVMEQESTYTAALEAASTFDIVADELTLKDAGDIALAVYSVTDQGLAGTSWQVISYNNGKGGVVSVILDTEITADFGADDQVTGNAGCNDYFAPYETDGDAITIGPAGTTRKMCSEPEGIMEQENQYLTALGSASTYKIEGLNMEMRTADGALAVNFRRAPGKKETTVTGSVTYRQRIALPDDAVVTVEIHDVSLADAPAKTIGQEVIETNSDQVPIPYEVTYDPDEIDERHTYSMFCRIEDGADELLYISDTSTPVITHGNPTQDVEIVVVPVGSP